MIDKLININEVMEMAGIKRTKLYELMGKQKFPSQVKIGTRGVRWRLSEIQEWIANA